MLLLIVLSIQHNNDQYQNFLLTLDDGLYIIKSTQSKEGLKSSGNSTFETPASL